MQIGNIRRQRHHPIRTVVQRLIEDDHVEELIASRRQQAPAHRTESGFKAIGLRISPCRADRARINVRTEYLPSSTCRAEPDRASPAPHVAQRLSGPWLIQACRREVVDEEPGRTTRARLVHPCGAYRYRSSNWMCRSASIARTCAWCSTSNSPLLSGIDSNDRATCAASTPGSGLACAPKTGFVIKAAAGAIEARDRATLVICERRGRCRSCQDHTQPNACCAA